MSANDQLSWKDKHKLCTTVGNQETHKYKIDSARRPEKDRTENKMKIYNGSAITAGLSVGFVVVVGDLFHWSHAFVPTTPRFKSHGSIPSFSNVVGQHKSSSLSSPSSLTMKSPLDAEEFYGMAAEQMKNLKPEDIDKMLEEMENMNPIQKAALKAMGMDPEMMKKSLDMMKKVRGFLLA